MLEFYDSRGDRVSIDSIYRRGKANQTVILAENKILTVVADEQNPMSTYPLFSVFTILEGAEEGRENSYKLRDVRGNEISVPFEEGYWLYDIAQWIEWNEKRQKWQIEWAKKRISTLEIQSETLRELVQNAMSTAMKGDRIWIIPEDEAQKFKDMELLSKT